MRKDMSESSLLTVVIPSYERLCSLLDLLGDLERVQDDVSVPVIVVNDGGNETIRQQVSALLGANEHWLTYLENPINLGIDANIDLCIRAAKTDYVLAVGDDDRLHIEHFKLLIEILSAQAPDLCICEYSYSDADLNIINEGVFSSSALRKLERPGDGCKHRFLFSHGTKLGFMGSVVFRQESYRRAASDLYRETYFSHVAAALTILFQEESRVSNCTKPVVINRAGDIRVTSWSSSAFEVIIGWWTMIEIWCAQCNAVTFDQYRKNKLGVTFQYDNIFWILSRRAENLIRWDNLSAIISKFELRVPVISMYVIACLIPQKVLLLAKRFWQKASLMSSKT